MEQTGQSRPTSRESENAANEPRTLDVLRDVLGRPLTDLRISITDRCNFRCTYCMPKEVFGSNFAFLPHQELLTFEEITRLATIFVSHGVRKIRLTGGEPLLRKDLEKLIAMLARIEGLEDIALTTNGSLLSPAKARALKEAGLQRVTISLDSLDDEVFMAMNDVRFPVSKVLNAIQAAQDAGLAPVKVNMVVKKGVNDQSILPMAHYFREAGQVLRFIEFMDVGTTNGWRLDQVVSAAEILATLEDNWPLVPLDPKPGQVATRYRYKDGKGEIGIIASVTKAFCSDCTRARISSEGLLYTCLFGVQGHDFREQLRSHHSDEEIGHFLRAVWGARGDRYSELRSENTRGLRKIEMSHIGG